MISPSHYSALIAYLLRMSYPTGEAQTPCVLGLGQGVGGDTAPGIVAGGHTKREVPLLGVSRTVQRNFQHLRTAIDRDILLAPRHRAARRWFGLSYVRDERAAGVAVTTHQSAHTIAHRINGRL